MERKSLFGNKRNGGTGNRPETFAMVVESYDLESKDHAVIGRRLDNGQQVRVTLRQNVQQNNPEYSRSEVADFASPRVDRNHPGTEPGGVLLAQEAFQNEDGVFAARWLQVLSHNPGEAEVFMATVTVSDVAVKTETVGNRPKIKYSCYMQLMHNGDFSGCSLETQEQLKVTPPFTVGNVAELREAVAALLMDDLGVGIRVFGEDGFDGSYIRYDRKAHKALNTEDEQLAHAQKAADEYIRGIGELAAQIDAGNVSCEVVPYSTIWAGPKTAQSLKTRPVMQQRLGRFGETIERTNRDPLRVQVYRPAVVAIRRTQPDEHGQSAIYFSHVEPLNTRPAMRGISDAVAFAATRNLAPEVPAQNANAAQSAAAAPAPAPAQHAAQDSGPDSGFGPSNDDLMGGLDDSFSAGYEEQPFDALPATPPAAAAATQPRAARSYGGRRA